MEKCLEDLENQTMQERMEIVVIDSASPEGEGRIVEQFQKKFNNIQYIRTEKRETLYAAWNRAIKLAKGDYLTSANTDDRHAPEAFETLSGALDQNKNVGVVYAGCAITDKANAGFSAARRIGEFKARRFDRRRLFWDCLPGPQPMWRKSLHQEFGYFDESFTSAGDYEFWLRISSKAKFLHVPKTLGVFLDHASSLSHQGKAAEEIELARSRYWPPEWGPRPKDPKPLLRKLTSRKTYSTLVSTLLGKR